MSETMCCPLGGYDDDPAKFYTQITRRAARDHKCSECGEAIQKNISYELVKGMWDGMWSSYRTCLLCVEIRDHFACGQGWVFGEVWEQLENNFFPDMKMGGPCMDGLSPAAKAALIDARMEWYLDQGEFDDSMWEDWANRRPPQP